MIPKIITATDFEIIEFEDSNLEKLLKEDFMKDPDHYRPKCVNRSAVRHDKPEPLFKLDEKTNELYGNGYVGVFRTQLSKDDLEYDLTIRFGSRFDKGKADGKKHYFLAALLQSWAGKRDNPPKFDDQITHASWDEIIDFLSVAVFRKQLMDAYETGIFRAYQYFEDNWERLRGSIDIPRHIRLNLGMHNGKIAMRYRENTPDNPMNHLILHTYDVLKQRHPALVCALIEGDDSKMILENLRYLAPSYSKTDPETVAAKLRQSISNPLYDTYEQLRDTCLRILNEQGISVFDAATEQENTFLFYSPDLWENFIEHQILSRLTGGEPDFQREVQCFAVPGFKCMELRPDFVFFKGNERIILDAKYKEKWNGFPNTKGLEDDLKQCLVYYTVFQATYTGVIFPAKTRMEACHCKVKFSEVDPKQDGSFRVFDVLIPPLTMDSYQDWRKALTNEEKNTARRIQALCEEAGASAREESS